MSSNVIDSGASRLSEEQMREVDLERLLATSVLMPGSSELLPRFCPQRQELITDIMIADRRLYGQLVGHIGEMVWDMHFLMRRKCDCINNRLVRIAATHF